MKNQTGTGVVKAVGDKSLNVVKDAAGKPTAQSEGFFSYGFANLESFDEVIAYYENKDNALTTGAGDEKRVLSAEESIVEIVNREIERAAKANAYQKTVAKFKPAEDPKAAFDKIVRTFMSLGLPEDMATAHAKAAIEENAKKNAE